MPSDKPLRSAGKMISAPAGAKTQLVGPSEKRVAIIFGLDNTNQVFFGTDDATAGGAQFGFAWAASTQPYLLVHYRDFGGMVNKPWFARSSAGTSNIWVIEVMRD